VGDPLLLEVIKSTQRSNPMQKCDAKRPCTACIVAKTVSVCVYNNERCLRPASMYSSRRADARLPGQRPTGPDPLEVLTTAPSHSLSNDTFSDTSSLAKLDRIPSTSSDATWIDEPAVQQADRVLHGDLILVRRNPLERYIPSETSPSTFTVPSFFQPTIPPELRIPLSPLGEEKLQVQLSETEAADLVMTACVPQMGDHRPQTYPQTLVGCGVWFVYPSWGYNSAVRKWTR
jgi:hypothetical protein